MIGEYGHTGTRSGGLSVHVGLRIPFGQLSRPPCWQGLGVAEDTIASDESPLWRPVEGTGRIRVATLTGVTGLGDDVGIYFL